MAAAELANMPAHRPSTDDKAANLPTSQEEAAGLLSVGERSVRHAIKVKKQADPALAAAVKDGHLAVSVALVARWCRRWATRSAAPMMRSFRN